MLLETETRVNRFMALLSKKAQRQTFVTIPEVPVSSSSGGIESRSLFEQLSELAECFNDQAYLIDEWREQIVQLLVLTLVDQEAGLTGEEYEKSILSQETCHAYLEVLAQVLADRGEAVTGLVNTLTRYDEGRTDRVRRGHFVIGDESPHPEAGMTEEERQTMKEQEEFLRTLEKQRLDVRPRTNLKTCIDGLRRLRNDLSRDERTELESATNPSQKRIQRITMERTIVDNELDRQRKILNKQREVQEGLEKELELFRDTYNARIEYYRQLQQVSDTVAPLELVDDASTELEKREREESALAKRISADKARHRYLLHLSTQGKTQVEHICIICGDQVIVGVLTVCGHHFCRDCFAFWWRERHTCPSCRKPIRKSEIYNVSYKNEPTQILADLNAQNYPPRDIDSSTDENEPLYEKMTLSNLQELKDTVSIRSSFGSKIDMIVRQIKLLRSNDAKAKVVIFSQWSDFLAVLERALKAESIGIASIDRKKENGLHAFRNDPSIVAFLLNAKSQSSGLTLVNAKYLILAEPLVNPRIELQAISRIHRIGQTQETVIMLFSINHTVEQGVLSLSTRKRLELMAETHQRHSSKEDDLETADSKELQQGLGKLIDKQSGEFVPADELWDALFSAHEEQRSQALLQNEADRHFRAEAAEKRATT